VFKEPTENYIAESLQKMDATDKKQLARFIDMQQAYKRANQVNDTIKSNPLTTTEIVGIVRKIRKENARNKK
jgi:hypothetical protein